MKKLVCMILAMVMALPLVAGGNKEERTVSTDGSTSMQKVINTLGEAFMEDTGANFTYNATGSGTRDGFESITDTEDTCQYRQELTSNGAVLTAVAENPNAIGYVSLSSVKDTVKAISVGGVAPSEATIKDGSYAVQRPFVLVTKEGMELSKTAQEFFDFATSPAANEIITAAGVVPVN